MTIFSKSLKFDDSSDIRKLIFHQSGSTSFWLNETDVLFFYVFLQAGEPGQPHICSEECSGFSDVETQKL